MTFNNPRYTNMKIPNLIGSFAKVALMTCGLLLLGSDADGDGWFILSKAMAAICFCIFFKLNK